MKIWFKLETIVLVTALFYCADQVEAAAVRVGVADISQSQLSLFVAKDKGYYRQEGLDVELVLMAGATANQALIAGNVDYTTVPTAGLTAALPGCSVENSFYYLSQGDVLALFQTGDTRSQRPREQKSGGVQYRCRGRLCITRVSRPSRTGGGTRGGHSRYRRGVDAVYRLAKRHRRCGHADNAMEFQSS